MKDPERIARNYATVRDRIGKAADRSGRSFKDVRLVAVTKTVGVEAVRALYDLGQRDFGENRVADAEPKLEAFAGTDVRWHMIGHLQRNKVKKVLGRYELIHSVDSVRLLREIEKGATARDLNVEVLIELNVAGEEQKWGITPSELDEILKEFAQLERVTATGLMMMAPLVEDAEQTRPLFRRLRELRDENADRYPRAPLAELSMGMTQDFEVAVEEGATMVRIGSALFR